MNSEVKTGSAKWLFLIGLFSQTQINVGGKLGISEFLMILIAPYVFLRNLNVYRRDGVGYFLVMILLWLAGAVFVDMYMKTYFPFMMRGIAVPITVFSCVVCVYPLLRENPLALKWLLLGSAISGVVSIFVFQRGLAGDVAAEQGLSAGIEQVVSYKLFLVNLLTTWLTLPIVGWYLSVPKWYSVSAMMFLTVFNLAAGGRSAFLVALCSMMIIMFAGKTVKSVVFLRRHVLTILMSLALLGVGAKYLYKHAAVSGLLGSEETRKYELQTKTGSDILHLLMGGRSEFFIGLLAAFDRPLLGNGSLALDEKGYQIEFLKKYGDLEDYQRALKMQRFDGMFFIPFHSHIVTYWMWHGIFALVFWATTIVLAIKTFLYRMHVCLPWCGYFAVTLPMYFWDVLFSPFGSRVKYSVLWVALLLVSKMAQDQKKSIGFIGKSA